MSEPMLSSQNIPSATSKPKTYISKEVSWLAFNARVLQEAQNPDVPLLERLKFLGIYSNNLDEFFRVRVATLQRLATLGREAKKFIGENPKKILREVQEIVVRQHKEFDRTYQGLLEQLENQNVYKVNEQQLSQKQGEFVRDYFATNVRRKLIPLMIDQVKEFPELRDRSIYLAVVLARSESTRRKKYALIEVPTDVLPRFLILPPENGRRYIMFLDDVIRYRLGNIFEIFGYHYHEAYTIKLTRDAELDIDDETWDNYVKKVSKSLKLRRGGNPVRFIYDANIPLPFLNMLVRELELEKDDTLIAGGRYHNFKDFMDFPDFGMDHLKYARVPSLPHKGIDRTKRLMETIKKRDILIHYAYQSFDFVIDLLREASIDPKVQSIKLTVYRVARNSSVMNALINAARNGKVVTVVMELQARFDEEANLYWGRKLEDEDITVIYGVPGLKVHSKICLIGRSEKGRINHYAIIGTGNFNEETARIYSDHALFTADKRLTGEVVKVFDFYGKNYKTATFRHLLVSPWDTRKKVIKLIQNEIKAARKGQKAEIFLKLNNLVDIEIVENLYAASQAGVNVKLIVRSMFSLVPGIEGTSENIRAISIVDKYLEHTRIFIFHNGGSPKYFISSADLMRRNLDRRVEVTCPIYDKNLQRELQDFMDIQWRDNVRARVLNLAMDNRMQAGESDQPVRAQWAIYDYLKKEHGGD